MSVSLFTGFPGFLGVELLPRLLRRYPQRRAVCLVQAKFADVARRKVELLAADESLKGRIKLVEGNITLRNLGLDDPTGIAANVNEIWHLAAVYDIAVPRDLAMHVNVEGTRHVCDLAERAPGLERLHYVSTCYVSGRHMGPFGEDDLDVGQHFNNFYEESKFVAEVEVQQRCQAGLPATVYRPAIVAGDSTTGETQKYDGFYFALQWVLRKQRVALMPVVGDPTTIRFNVVPRDFVVDAIDALAANVRSRNRVYQLADPQPLTVDELYGEMERATGRRIVRVPITRWLAKLAIERTPGAYQLLRIPSGAIDYLAQPTQYLTDNARADLDGTGLACPVLPSYLPTLVDFMRRHPEVSSAPMV
jgi:thioester reductase-like protein